MQRGYKVVAAVLGIVGIIAIAVVITLAIERRPPAFTTVGAGIVTAPVFLHQEPAESTSITGKLNAGESVEILQYLPARTLDSWVFVRSGRDPKINGYTTLSSIDQLKTGNAELDVWHATQLVGKASGAELKERLTAIGEMLKTPLPASPALDRIYQTLATESVRLANSSIDNKDEARTAIGEAESYLSRVSDDSQVSPEIEGIRSAIQGVHVALEDVPAPPQTVAPAVPSPRTELTRLMKEANAAFASGRYGKAADLSQQVVSKGQGKRDLTKVVDEAKALQKKAETAQEELEKNIQNR
jgi:hypothetical protein